MIGNMGADFCLSLYVCTCHPSASLSRPLPPHLSIAQQVHHCPRKGLYPIDVTKANCHVN